MLKSCYHSRCSLYLAILSKCNFILLQKVVGLSLPHLHLRVRGPLFVLNFYLFISITQNSCITCIYSTVFSNKV